MTRVKLVMVRDDEGYEYLDYAPGDWSVVNESPPATLENLAELCDLHAESRNNYDFIGVHRILAAILFAQIGREQATIIMREIAELGGLDGASGKYWHPGGSAFDEFGIKPPWDEWSLPG